MKARTELISVRLTPEEKRRMEYCAEMMGITQTELLVRGINRYYDSVKEIKPISLLECTHDNYRHSHRAAADTKRQQPSRKETTMQYKDWDGNGRERRWQNDKNG